MPVNVPNPGNFQQQIGQHAVALREALQSLLNDAAYLNSMGGTTFLTGQMGVSAADATVIMNTIGAVIPSNAVVQQIQSFLVNTEPLWGGQ